MNKSQKFPSNFQYFRVESEKSTTEKEWERERIFFIIDPKFFFQEHSHIILALTIDSFFLLEHTHSIYVIDIIS